VITLLHARAWFIAAQSSPPDSSTPDVLNLAFLVHFKDIDAFEVTSFPFTLVP